MEQILEQGAEQDASNGKNQDASTGTEHENHQPGIETIYNNSTMTGKKEQSTSTHSTEIKMPIQRAAHTITIVAKPPCTVQSPRPTKSSGAITPKPQDDSALGLKLQTSCPIVQHDNLSVKV